jgi:hypothetical protein
MVNMTLIPLLSHLVLRPKLNALLLCVPRSSFIHKVTNSETNSITSVYYIESYYKTITRARGLNNGNKHHDMHMTRGPHA